MIKIQRGTEAQPISIGDKIHLYGVQAYSNSECDNLSCDNEFNSVFEVQDVSENGVLSVLMPAEPLSVYPRGGCVLHSQELLDEKHVYLDWK